MPQVIIEITKEPEAPESPLDRLAGTCINFYGPYPSLNKAIDEMEKSIFYDKDKGEVLWLVVCSGFLYRAKPIKLETELPS